MEESWEHFDGCNATSLVNIMMKNSSLSVSGKSSYDLKLSHLSVRKTKTVPFNQSAAISLRSFCSVFVLNNSLFPNNSVTPVAMEFGTIE